MIQIRVDDDCTDRDGEPCREVHFESDVIGEGRRAAYSPEAVRYEVNRLLDMHYGVE